MARTARGWAALLATLLALPLLGGCITSTTYYGAPAADLHGKPLLLLKPSLLAPTSAELHEHVVGAVEKGLRASPEVGPITGREQVQGRKELPLKVLDAYDLFSNTLSLTGVPDPELAARLANGLGVDLLAVAQPSYLPCPICEQGDELWLVGQVVNAHTGRIVFRDHLKITAHGSDPDYLRGLADDLTAEYLADFNRAFHLRAHRQRFQNLKALASG